MTLSLDDATSGADPVQLEQDPQIAFADLEVQRRECLIQCVVAEGSSGRPVTEYVERGFHLHIVDGQVAPP